jgi:hypothetical protein
MQGCVGVSFRVCAFGRQEHLPDEAMKVKYGFCLEDLDDKPPREPLECLLEMNYNVRKSSNKNTTQSSTIMDKKPDHITKGLLVVRVPTPALSCSSTACSACITGCDRVLLSCARSL